MKAVCWVALALWAVGCGAPKGPPDIISRELAGSGAPAPSEAPGEWDDTIDAGLVDARDAGPCCSVAFTVGRQADDVSVELVVGPAQSRFAMTQTDGGEAWELTTCLPLVDTFYWYDVRSFSGEDDGGLFVSDRVNEGAPMVPADFVSQVNLFEVGQTMACESLDAGVHGALPDAGP